MVSQLSANEPSGNTRPGSIPGSSAMGRQADIVWLRWSVEPDVLGTRSGLNSLVAHQYAPVVQHGRGNRLKSGPVLVRIQPGALTTTRPIGQCLKP